VGVLFCLEEMSNHIEGTRLIAFIELNAKLFAIFLYGSMKNSRSDHMVSSTLEVVHSKFTLSLIRSWT
jgi:hypothetical protein